MKSLENIREVFRNLKHRRPTKIYCPCCCSSEIQLHSSFDIWLTPQKYRCNKCGYLGPIVMEIEKAETEINTTE